MQAHASWKRRGGAIFAVTVFLLPILAQGAQRSKASAVKAAGQAAPVDDQAIWRLAGREGACVPLSILERKSAAFKGIKSPYELGEKLKAMGHKVDLKEFKAGIRPALEVRAPSAGIHVMFIKRENCDKKPAAEKK